MLLGLITHFFVRLCSIRAVVFTTTTTVADASHPSSSSLLRPPLDTVAAAAASSSTTATAAVASDECAAAPSSSSASPLSLVAAVVVPAPLLTYPESCFPTHGFVLQKVDERAVELSEEIESANLKDAEYTLVIAGKVQQLDLVASKQPGGLSAQQLARILALAVDTAHRHTGIPSARLEVRSIKLLTARRGEGEQMIHFDHRNGFICKGRFSFLIYVTEGTQSTAMWRHPLSQLPQRATKVAMKAAYAQLFHKQQYHSVAVHQGQSMFFDERAPHFGRKNEIRGARRVVFVQIAGLFIGNISMAHLTCLTSVS
jgi:hypothetical protein